ncbi:MAG: hypothetical protein M2R45_00389 [Verrucomicrobia subdivision 3 bacterium]|nr:hypothetical protein [Limisphaerales bacterium]MCS1412852.1 hypothetical protein [Limisphaerales bacterium]
MSPLRARFFKPLMCCLIVIFLSGVSFVQKSLNRARSDMGLTRLEPLENAPPVLAFTTVALGGFRGLIANLLWIRATQLQDDGKYFEMVQLADWITKLQPHFVTVWIHQAWNLSYNISVKFPDHADRWQWVQRGIELLRDQGIPWNPQETMLYRELAWHFQHKMGASMDDAHMLYKNEWAKWMDGLFDGRAPNFDKFIDPQTPEDQERARRLREEFKMDINAIKQVEEEYGPLEWRLPETHAIYWAYLGLQRSIRQKDYINLRRMLFQSMQTAFHRGRLFEFPIAKERESDGYVMGYEFGPNIAITETVNGVYEQMMEEDEAQREHISTAHKNFLRTAIYFLYTHNRVAEATKYYDYVRELYPGSIPDEVSLEEYAFQRLEEEFGSTSQDRMKAMMLGILGKSFFYLAIGEQDRAIGMELLVRKMWDRFHGEIGKGQDVRVGLPPIPELKREVLLRMLDPKEGLAPVLADQLRTRLGPALREFLPELSGLPPRTACP